MKVKCLLVLMIFMVATMLIADATQGGLIAAYYKMDESVGATTIVDSSGNGIDMTAPVSPYTGELGVSGLATDRAIEIEDSNAETCPRTVLTAAQMSLFSTETFTIEAWIKNPTLSSLTSPMMGIFQHRQTVGRTGFHITRYSQLALDYTTNGGTVGGFQTGGLNFEADTWYHVAVVYDNNGSSASDDSTVTFYATALGETSPSVVTTLTNQVDIDALVHNGSYTRASYVGCFDGANQRTLGGCLDEVIYTSAALSPSELNFPVTEVPEPSTMVFVVDRCRMSGSHTVAAPKRLAVKNFPSTPTRAGTDPRAYVQLLTLRQPVVRRFQSHGPCWSVSPENQNVLLPHSTSESLYFAQFVTL